MSCRFLSCYPNGCLYDSERGYLGVFLRLESEISIAFTANIRLGIISKLGYIEQEKEFNQTGDSFKAVGFPMFLKHNELFDEKSGLVSDGVLALRCEVRKISFETFKIIKIFLLAELVRLHTSSSIAARCSQQNVDIKLWEVAHQRELRWHQLPPRRRNRFEGSQDHSLRKIADLIGVVGQDGERRRTGDRFCRRRRPDDDGTAALHLLRQGKRLGFDRPQVDLRGGEVPNDGTEGTLQRAHQVDLERWQRRRCLANDRSHQRIGRLASMLLAHHRWVSRKNLKL